MVYFKQLCFTSYDLIDLFLLNKSYVALIAEPVKEKSLGLFTKVGNIFTSTPKQPAQKKRRSVRKDYKFPTPIPFDEFIRQLDNSAESAGIESIEETEQVSDRKERDQETADPEPKQPMQFVEEIRQGESQTTQTGSRPVEA
ncbi:hypothetical protein J6590_009719 [Homalodisca vitripennis]|nr:hypothetical protein J6590_009719 [Homalodisca vitripennis]